MIDLISITETRSGDNPVDEVEFDPVPITKSDTESVWIQNELSDASIKVVNVEAESEGSGEITVDEYPEIIPEDGSGQLKMTASPIESKELSGISTNIKIDVKTVVRP